MPLIIIESPNKIAKLKKILGGEYTIMATKGHVMDLPPKTMGVDVKNNFTPMYQAIEGKGKVIKDIAAEAKGHDVIYLATDPDREGEAIAAHIAMELPKRGKTIHRIRFNSITRDAVHTALANPTPIDLNLYDAQQARRVTDRLVGYKVSPIMWAKGIKGASAGRVQSVALKYVVELEREIRAFVPEEYWEIDANVDLGSGFKARMWGVDGKAKDITEGKIALGAKKLLDSGDKTLTVTSIEKKDRKRVADPPFTTSSLQQAANNVLGWGVDKTMLVAQKLFEIGAITYHRTDSVNVDPEKISSLRKEILANHGREYLPEKPNEYKSGKSSQEAHEAIRPTGDDASGVDDDGRRLLSLITNRFTASQMVAARFEQVKVALDYKASKTTLNFRANGSLQTFDGFLKVYGAATENVILPNMAEGQVVPFTSVEANQKFTQPPSRLSDAGLVKQMEKDGVGRPATYASTIKTLLSRSFVGKDKRSFHATELGEIVYDYLVRFFPDLVSPEFTAKMETSLDDVAEGKSTYVNALTEFYDPFKVALGSAKKGDIKDLMRTEHLCPACNTGHLLKYVRKDGSFYGCERYPDCKTIATIVDGKPVLPEPKAPAEVSEEYRCPLCAGPTIKRNGKYGEFYGCAAWSKTRCKGSVKIKKEGEEEKPRGEKTGIKCPKCEKEMLKLPGKYGPFLGCSGYPDCKTILGIPLGTCPKDGGHVVEKYSKKKKKKFYACMNYPKCDFATDSLTDFKQLSNGLELI